MSCFKYNSTKTLKDLKCEKFYGAIFFCKNPKLVELIKQDGLQIEIRKNRQKVLSWLRKV